jgi:hypothetical protein
MAKDSTTHICATCEKSATGKKITSGSFIGEVAIWIITFMVASIFDLWILLILPFIYSVIRTTSKKTVCEYCGSTELIPINSPRAQRILSQH